MRAAKHTSTCCAVRAGKPLEDIKLGAITFDRKLSQLEAPKVVGIDSWYCFDYITDEQGNLSELLVRQASLIGEGQLVRIKDDKIKALSARLEAAGLT